VTQVNLPEALRRKFGDDRLLRRYFFGRAEENRIETALPHQKGSLALRYARAALSGLLRASYYGPVVLRPDNSANDERFGGKVLLDFEASYQLSRKLRLTLGAENFLNTFPDRQDKPANTSAGRFVYSNLSQFGVNGGFYYGRLQLSFF
jgi:iron complex outermembrane receptor protein